MIIVIWLQFDILCNFPTKYCCFLQSADTVCLSAVDSATNHESSVDVIRLDVSRTFPHLGIFQKVNLLIDFSLLLKPAFSPLLESASYTF